MAGVGKVTLWYDDPQFPGLCPKGVPRVDDLGRFEGGPQLSLLYLIIERELGPPPQNDPVCTHLVHEMNKPTPWFPKLDGLPLVRIDRMRHGITTWENLARQIPALSFVWACLDHKRQHAVIQATLPNRTILRDTPLLRSICIRKLHRYSRRWRAIWRMLAATPWWRPFRRHALRRMGGRWLEEFSRQYGRLHHGRL